MSEETPDKVEDKPEEPAVKKKAARKRSKAADAEAPAASAPEDAAPVFTTDQKPASDEAPATSSEGSDSQKAPLEDGETPTENPSVRRISSKRKTGGVKGGASDQKSADSPEGDDSPEQVPTIVEPPAADSPGKKRRRRRRKGSAGDGDDEGDGGRAPSRSRVPLDSEKVEKKAWKIFLSEVSEEGLALVSDQDAKEIGRRSFRLAEIFLEEASKRQ